MDKIEMRIIQEGLDARWLICQWCERDGTPRMAAVDFGAPEQDIFQPFFADLLERIAKFIRDDWYEKQEKMAARESP